MAELARKPAEAIPHKAGAPRKGALEVLESAAFKDLVKRRWTVNVVLLALLFITYYGYILAIAWAKPFMSQKIGEVTTLAIPVGVAVIVIAWALTAYYVIWANGKYDPEVERLKNQIEK